MNNEFQRLAIELLATILERLRRNGGLLSPEIEAHEEEVLANAGEFVNKSG